MLGDSMPRAADRNLASGTSFLLKDDPAAAAAAAAGRRSMQPTTAGGRERDWGGRMRQQMK